MLDSCRHMFGFGVRTVDWNRSTNQCGRHMFGFGVRTVDWNRSTNQCGRHMFGFGVRTVDWNRSTNQCGRHMFGFGLELLIGTAALTNAAATCSGSGTMSNAVYTGTGAPSDSRRHLFGFGNRAIYRPWSTRTAGWMVTGLKYLLR